MTIGINDVAAVQARYMIPVYQAQIAYHKQRASKLKLSKALSHTDSDDPNPSIFDMFIKSAELSQLSAEINLNHAREVVSNHDKRKTSSQGIQDASEMVPDQGQPEGTDVQAGQDTLPDTHQDQNG